MGILRRERHSVDIPTGTFHGVDRQHQAVVGVAAESRYVILVAIFADLAVAGRDSSRKSPKCARCAACGSVSPGRNQGQDRKGLPDAGRGAHLGTHHDLPAAAHQHRAPRDPVPARRHGRLHGDGTCDAGQCLRRALGPRGTHVAQHPALRRPRDRRRRHRRIPRDRSPQRQGEGRFLPRRQAGQPLRLCSYSFSAISAIEGTKTIKAVRSRSDSRKGPMPMKVSFIGVSLAMLLMM